MLGLNNDVTLQRAMRGRKFGSSTVEFSVTSAVLARRKRDNAFTKPFHANPNHKSLEFLVSQLI